MSQLPTVLVTGATGLIGRAVCARGAELGWRVVPLQRSVAGRAGRSGGRRAEGAGRAPHAERAGGVTPAIWDWEAGQVEWGGAGPFDVVIHLAGETVAQRWTRDARRRIYESRVRGTEVLGRALSQMSSPPRVVICASATGYYGDGGDQWLQEDSPRGTGFLAEVCRAWEAAATRTLGEVTRLVLLRFGLVLTPRGGALARMLPVFRWGLGGRLGSGRQYWSWITLSDLLRLLEFVIADERLGGPFNAVTPEPVTNAGFTRELAAALGRPAIFPVPRWVVLAAFGQMGREALLSGARVRPQRVTEAGFEFRQPALGPALREMLRPAVCEK